MKCVQVRNPQANDSKLQIFEYHVNIYKPRKKIKPLEYQ